MEIEINERVENKSIKTRYILFLIFSIVLLASLFGSYLFLKIDDTQTPFSIVLAVQLTFGVLIIPSLFERLKNLKRRMKEAIEWNDEGITFYRTQIDFFFVNYLDIDNIIVNTDSINIWLKNGEQETYSIKDYGDYNARKKIKENFAVLQNKLGLKKDNKK